MQVASAAVDTGSAAMRQQVQLPTRLNMYQDPPSMEVTLERFERLALDRLEGTPRATPRPRARRGRQKERGVATGAARRRG